MAKTQTFGDKLKKKKQDQRIYVKVIKWFKDDARGTLRSMEKIVPVNDIAEVDKIDISILEHILN